MGEVIGQIELGKIQFGVKKKKKKCFCSDKREGCGEREKQGECPGIIKPQLTCIVLTLPTY